MVHRHSVIGAVFAAWSLAGCDSCGGKLADGDAAADAATEMASLGPTCALAVCAGTIELPVGATITGDDYCNWECLEAGPPTCPQSGPTCECFPGSAPHNQCDGGEGPYGPAGPSCLVPSCSGPVSLPSRAAMLGGDGCLYSCGANDGHAECGPYLNRPCVCGVLECDGGSMVDQ